MKRHIRVQNALVFALAVVVVGCQAPQGERREMVIYANIVAPEIEGVPEIALTVKATPTVDPADQLRRQLEKDLQSFGLLPGDDERLASLYAEFDQYLLAKNYTAAEKVLDQLKLRAEEIDIDEVFIVRKNSRLLAMIQEVNPGDEVLQEIDRESERINNLLERSDFKEINRRLNRLFRLLQTGGSY